ncbi:hypothetical protein R4E38_13960 [Morganella morganii]|uniref:Uncharacterized protein n=1 Tax=Morganella morganii subsp. morganii KT TaxID=1124991 RepID=J7U4P9_MORMO|nr:hypothetical protein [Morganella morganii]AGG29160.1 hypothetical protein MU9_114 [Morganella morganii subsp. morganii KT]EJK8625331.1 hypothetical protein [Morganella morganii]EKW5727405.1 hypothetical protein [Morganella morganii]ELA9133906.1 hypothetical protein [Morganella morganii]ELW9224974.1 hypothetical protein [Morganella morganii]
MSTFWEGLLSSSISLAVIGFVCKIFLKHIDKRELESFKNKLKYESDIKIKEEERNYDIRKTRDLEIGRWGLTLLSAANGFLGRLCYIKEQRGLSSDQYIIDSTKFYLCQYLFWAQLFRKNRDSSVFSPTNDEMLITELIKNISITLRENTLGLPCIRSLEQQYIGDSLNINGGCMTYKEFIDVNVLSQYSALNDFVDSILNDNNKEFINIIIVSFQDLKSGFEATLQKK